MVFDIKNKVALVTGGASGIGLAIVKKLLQKGIKGVVIADINVEAGEKVSKELNRDFDGQKVIFVRTDVADFLSYENAFKVIIETFKSVDILVNNAGILKDQHWEKEIHTNLKGIFNGMILGLETYLNMYKQGEEAVILNTSSVAAIEPTGAAPFYSATKGAVMSLTRSWGIPFHYDRTKVKVITFCPGLTDTSIFNNGPALAFNATYAKAMEAARTHYAPVIQSADHVANECMSVMEKATNGTLWIIEENLPAYEYVLPDRRIFRNNILK